MKFINLNLSYPGWNKTSPLITCVRTALSFLIYGVFSSVYYLVDTDVPVEQIYSLLAIKSLIPSFFSAFIIFAFARLLFYKLKLVNERAIGRMFEINDEEEGDFTSASK